MATKSEFEVRKTQIENSIRDVDLEILECKLQVKQNHLEAAKIDIETSQEVVRKAQLGLKAAKVTNDIQEQKLQQLEDNLQFENAMTLLNQEMLLIKGKSALLALEQAQAQLESNAELFEIGG